jgi:hypothetical protein
MRLVEGFRLRDVMGQATVIGEGAGQVNFNKLITLNESAAFLWRSLEGRDFDADVVAKLLMDEYGIDAELASKDAAVILAQWCEVGLAE